MMSLVEEVSFSLDLPFPQSGTMSCLQLSTQLRTSHDSKWENGRGPEVEIVIAKAPKLATNQPRHSFQPIGFEIYKDQNREAGSTGY